MYPINKRLYLSPDVAEATDVETPVEETDEDESPEPIDVRGVIENVYQVKGKKGKGKGKLYLMFKPDLTLASPFVNYVKMVSPEYWNKVVKHSILDEACKYATKQAIGNDGLISTAKFAEAFVDWFSPVTRGGIKEFKDQLEEVIGELQPFLLLSAQNKPIPHEDQPRFAELLAQWQDLSEKIENKNIKGKARKQSKVAKAA